METEEVGFSAETKPGGEGIRKTGDEESIANAKEGGVGQAVAF